MVKGVPSAAIEDMVSNGSNWEFDCSTYKEVLFLYAAYKQVGKDAFNARYSNGSGGYNLTIRQFGSDGVKIKKNFSLDKKSGTYIDGLSKDSKSKDDMLNNIPIGAMLEISTEVEDYNGPRAGPFMNGNYLNENMIKIGDDKFAGLGLEEGKTYSLQEAIDYLNKNYSFSGKGYSVTNIKEVEFE